MNYGHYYKLNTEKSDLTQKVAVFDYMGVVSKEAGTHDIYAIIINDGIHFEYHFHNDKDSSHIHADIAFLPFVSTIDGHDKLSRVVEECHDVTFPAEIDRTAQNPVDIYNPFTNKFITPSDRSLNSGGYSGLGVFEVGAPKENGNIIRRMILDFLFDLEHSKVFQVSPYHGQVQEMIHVNPLTSAIFARAEYYYQRQQQIERDVIINDSIRARINFADDYTMAEKRWVDFLCSEQADRLLSESSWLMPKKGITFVAKELNRVYRSKKNNLASCDYVMSIPNPVEEKNISKKRDLSHRVRQTARRAQIAYLHHYSLLGVLHTWFGGGLITNRGLFPVGLLDLFLPRLLAAIIAAWLSIYNYKFINIDKHVLNILLLMLTLLVSYVFYEIKKKNIFLSSSIILLRTGELLVISFFYSILVGSILMKIVSTAPCPCIINTNSILPPIIPTTISVFIGIFIHMLFENKSLTES